jgi:hypothetical protein
MIHNLKILIYMVVVAVVIMVIRITDIWVGRGTRVDPDTPADPDIRVDPHTPVDPGTRVDPDHP